MIKLIARWKETTSDVVQLHCVYHTKQSTYERECQEKQKKKVGRIARRKKLLLQDLRSGTIPLDMPPRDVYVQRPELAEFDGSYKHFPGCLRLARKQIICKNHSSASDSAALAHDRDFFLQVANITEGGPRWEGSAAQRHLQQDIEDGKHKTMTPKQLFESRKEYNEDYSLKVFREHIYQEDKGRKFLMQYGSRRKNQQC